MIINNVKLEFDFLDADNIAKLEKALNSISEKAGNAKKTKMSMSEHLIKECSIIKEFFDEVFGDGVAYKIFGEKNNLMTCIKALEDVVTAKLETQSQLEQTLNKYSPNRAQRRNKK